MARHVLLILLCWFSTAAAQSPGDRRGSQLPFLPSSARSAAVGDALGAVPGQLDALLANPAGLGWLGVPQGEYTVYRISPDASLQRLAAAFPAGNSAGLGVHVDLLHHGGLGFFGRSELRDRGFELRAGAAAGFMIAEDLSAGIHASALHATTDPDPDWAFSADAGITYAPGRHHRFGVALRGLGSDFDVTNPVLPPDVADPRPPRAITFSSAFASTAGSHRFLILLEGERLLGRPGVLYRSGIEYLPVPLLALRGGVQVRGAATAPRAGIGISPEPVAVDYAYLFNRRDRGSHLVSVRLLLR